MNGEAFTSGLLFPGDVVQLGPDGPLLRLRLQLGEESGYKSLREALADCVDCARYGADSLPGRTALLLRSMPRELLTATAPWVRVLVAGSFLVVLASAAFQVVESRDVDRRFAEARSRMEAVAESLRAQEARTDITPARLDSLGRAVVEGLDSRETNGADLDRASRSVMLLLGAYGFEDPDSGRPIRMQPSVASALETGGRSPVGPDVDGPMIVRRYMGSAFAVTTEGHFVTNRHLVRPWEQDGTARQLVSMGYRPVLRRMLGFLPGREEPVSMELAVESDSVDLALLHAPELAGHTEPLALAEGTPRLGEAVYLLGYPTGVRALLARSDPDFLEFLREGSAGLDLPAVARRLASEGQVAPLATRGIVGQVSGSAVVYDAETTHGGSGGPVLGDGGRVLAVNMGLMPEFGGSNLGVPVRQVRRLLAKAGVSP